MLHVILPVPKMVGVDVCGSTCPNHATVDRSDVIGVFSYEYTCLKDDRCITRWLGVLQWDDIYPKGCRGAQTYLARRVACWSTHVSKVVRVDLPDQIGVLHVALHVSKVVGVDVCGSTCPKGAKGRPNWHDRSVFMWVHIPQR